MFESNGVFFIKTAEARAKELTSQTLNRFTSSVVPPLSRLKGEYYRQLRESGVPEATAATLVLSEEISKGLLSSPTSPTRDVHSESPDRAHSQTNSEPIAWFAWAAFGSLGIEFFQRIPLLLLHFILAIAVWATARRTQRSGMILTYLSPFFWGLATLIGGVFVAGLYWVIHHSSLRKPGEVT